MKRYCFYFNHVNNISFEFKEKITGATRNNVSKDVNIIIPLKYLRSFWKTLEMPFINSEINVIPAWFEKCSLVAGTAANRVLTFPITDAKLYAPVVTLSTQKNAKQLKLNN